MDGNSTAHNEDPASKDTWEKKKRWLFEHIEKDETRESGHFPELNTGKGQKSAQKKELKDSNWSWLLTLWGVLRKTYGSIKDVLCLVKLKMAILVGEHHSSRGARPGHQASEKGTPKILRKAFTGDSAFRGDNSRVHGFGGTPKL